MTMIVTVQLPLLFYIFLFLDELFSALLLTLSENGRKCLSAKKDQTALYSSLEQHFKA